MGKRIDARTLSEEAREVVRRRAVEAVMNGMSQTEAAEVFGVSRQSVAGWVKRYRQEGDKGLVAAKSGRPAGQTQLKGWQAAWVVRALTDKSPDQMKLPFALWTRQAVCELIERRFGVSISVWTAGRWLRKWGFTPQKPVRRAFEQNPEAVGTWLEETYPGVRDRARQQGAEIHWGDEMGMRSDHQTGRTWGLKGKTPVVAGTGQRFGCNLISSVTNRGTLRFMVFKERFTANVFIEFLGRLIKDAGRKVILIVDNHPVHRSKKVRQWLARRQGQIELVFLPPYSPDLNPDEMLNNDVKSNALGRRRPGDREELMHAIRGYLHSAQRRPGYVRNYFKAPTVRYAAQ
jgi:transposase